MEEFENKIDKISSGQDDDSWLGQLYSKMSATLMDKSGSDNTGSLDGLEPPMFDETWDPAGTSVNGAGADTDKSVRMNEINSDLAEGPFKDVVENIIPSLVYGDHDGQSADRCERNFLKCSGGILVNGGLQHMNEPEGISGALRKMMFKVAFHGGLGNFWNALMTVPEARGIKRCLNERDECVSKQLLAEELERSGVEAGEATRLLINPDFAQATDDTDGSQMFSPEDQKMEDQLSDD